MVSIVSRNLHSKNAKLKSIGTGEIMGVELPSSGETGNTARNHLVFGAANSVGKSRSHNEDNLFASSFFSIGLSDPFEIGLFAVADGMGGHLSGEVASSKAIDTISNKLLTKLVTPPPSLSQENIFDTLEGIIEEAFLAAQEAVLRSAPGGGTTLTVAICFAGIVAWGHVGDSRLYHLDKRSNLNRITHDHSLVGRLVELGQISEAEVEDHPQKNVLIKALGQLDGFKVDLGHFILKTGEKIILCSDGLWGQVSDKNIVILTKAYAGLSQACSALVQAANDAGGPDNISVIMVEYQ